MKVQAGKLYRMVNHKGMPKNWLEKHGIIWLATRGEYPDSSRHILGRDVWFADFKSIVSGHEFHVSRHEPWSVELEEADGGDT